MWLRSATTLVLLAALAACSSTRRVPWTDADGRSRGEIVQYEVEHGWHYDYFDLSGRLQRVEHRDSREEFVAGACATEFDYDSEGRVTSKRYLNAADEPSMGYGGFAGVRYAYATTGDGDSVEERTLHDAAGQVCAGDAGYALARIVYRDAGPGVRNVSLSDASGGPASATWDGIGSTARVEYTVLDGVGKVVYGVYFDAAGDITVRKRISGRTAVLVDVEHHQFYGY